MEDPMRLRQRTDPSIAGFSLIELLVVVAIMAIMTAVALPAIARYFRNYEIKQAASDVSGEITAARNKAIMKNVNWGVVFMIGTDATGRPTRYRYLIEDDQTPPRASVRMTPAQMFASPPQMGPMRELPEGIVFGAGCTGFVGSDKGFRFNRLGGWCDPTASNAGCPDFQPASPPAAAANLVMNTAGAGARVCLVQARTGLRREVRVAPGGRVLNEGRQR
jgi:prepilin-type N-terminal cleavage/methylation domain-containing protein